MSGLAGTRPDCCEPGGWRVPGGSPGDLAGRETGSVLDEGRRQGCSTHSCRIVGVINVHNYLPAHIVIELCLDLPDEREERTMIVNSSGQIMVKTVHDHERGPEIGLA